MPSAESLTVDAIAVRGARLGHAIGASHLSWELDAATTRSLEGVVTSRHIGPLRVSWIRLFIGEQGWSGRRTERNIADNPEPYLTVVMPLTGAITLCAAEREALVGEHEIAMWDSSWPLAFAVEGRVYEQISVLIPQRTLRANAAACQALHAARINEDNILAELCQKHVATVAKFLDRPMRPYELSLTHVTTSLVDAVIASVYKEPRDRDVLVGEIRNYIECYIDDDALAPKPIAEAFNISTRYLHKLFASTGMTVNEWIINRRLERSADELVTTESSVTDIAFKWGFKALGHYSRTFKQRFGVTPTAYRRTAQAASR